MRTIGVRAVHRGATLAGQVTPRDLLEEKFSVTSCRLVPPPHVMNAVFREGGSHDDGYRFKPFAVDDEEWREIAGELESLGARWLPPPEWVQTPEDWRIWALEVRKGAPADEHRRLWEAYERAAAAVKEAMKEDPDSDRVVALHLAAVREGSKLARFFESYIRRPDLPDAPAS